MGNDDRIRALEALDPGQGRPGYWERLCGQILERAAFELARRREAARQSVTAVLSGWSRSLIPVAAAAAVVAAIMIATEAGQDRSPAPGLVFEDVLGGGLDESAFQAALQSDAKANAAAFLAFVEGTP